MKLILGDIEYALGHQDLTEISYILDDSDRTKDLWHELSQSPVTVIRLNVARQRYLHDKTIRLLLYDNQIDVLRKIIGRHTFMVHMEKSDIERFISTGDHEILCSLAEHVGELTEDGFQICQKEWLCQELVQQSDPAVLFKLAENYDCSTRVLEKLSEHPDVNIAQKANETLLDRREDNSDEEYEYI